MLKKKKKPPEDSIKSNNMNVRKQFRVPAVTAFLLVTVTEERKS